MKVAIRERLDAVVADVVAGGRWTTSLASVLLAGVWTAVVSVWPGPWAGDEVEDASRRADALIAVGTIMATVEALLLTVGFVALQVSSQFSWRITRRVMGWHFVGALSLVAILGVILPLWVSVHPTMLRTGVAAVGAGYSALILGQAIWEVARRTGSDWLANALSVGALRHERRTTRDKERYCKQLAEDDTVLGEFAAAPGLLEVDFRRAIVSRAVTLNALFRNGTPGGDIAVSVRDMSMVVEVGADARARAVVAVLGGIGILISDDPQVNAASRECLLEIAHQARIKRAPRLAAYALDALTEVVDSRLQSILPRTSALETRQGGQPRDLDLWAKARQPASFRKRTARRRMPDDVVGRFGRGEDISPVELAAGLAHESIARRRTLDHSPDELPGRPDHYSDAYNLINETVESLRALMPAPRPDGSLWPSGWQGEGALETDIQRLARLAGKLYERGQYPPSDVVEEALEEVAGRLRAEPVRDPDVAADRTGWRLASRTRGAGGPIERTADCLGMLMKQAFDYGFDRRALRTGRRILAAASACADANDLHGLEAFEDALGDFIRDCVLHSPLGEEVAGRCRQTNVLSGLIVETDPLLRHEHDSRVGQRIHDIGESLVWSVLGSESRLGAQCWQSRLIAAGWLSVDPAYSAPPRIETLSPGPLAPHILRACAESMSRGLTQRDPVYAATLVTIMWAHAVASAQEGGRRAARRVIATTVANIRRVEHAYMSSASMVTRGHNRASLIHPQLRRIIGAASRWAVLPFKPAHFPASEYQSLECIARNLLNSSSYRDRTYRDIKRCDGRLVMVTEADGSNRLLRDYEVRARGQFSWGYGGTGPHNLADAMILDLLDDFARCPTCLGAAPSAAELIRCKSCEGSGVRPWLAEAASILVTKVISSLPREQNWNLTRSQLLAILMTGIT